MISATSASTAAQPFNEEAPPATVLTFPPPPVELPVNGAVVEQSGAEKLLALYHRTAAGAPNAVFMFGSVTPAKTKDAPKAPWHAQKFKIGNVAEMAAEARARGAFANVYFGPALMRGDLAKGKRGEAADIVAVLAVIIEEDADTGKRVTLPTGVLPSFVVTTSSKPEINRHFHFVLDKPLPPAEAKELAELMYRKCGGDNCGRDIVHVWRLPQTLNHPTPEKIERGRPETPQLVELTGGTGKAIDANVLRAALQAMPDIHTEKKSVAVAEWTSGGSKDRDAILARLNPVVRARIDEEGQDRSTHCFTVMMGLFDAGLTDSEVCVVAAGAAFARKFSEHGDLDAEIRRARTRWKASQDAAGVSIEGMLSDGTLKKMFVARHKDDLRYVATQGKWYCYDGKRWHIDNKREHLENAWRLCRDVAQKCLDSGQDRLVRLARTIDSIKTVKATLELASADPELAATVDQWDADPWALNTPGGVVDLRTGEMRPQRAEDCLSKLTLVSPDREMKTPVWLSFLDYTMCGDKEVIAYTQRVLGYCLTGSIREHALFFGWGPGGNGKGTLVNTAVKSMADYAQIAPIDTFTASKHSRHETELARMQGARLVTASETEEGKRWDEAKIKWLTGGDRISARFMRGDYFEFNPQHKLLIVGNHKPGIRTADEAIRRRFHLIPFNATVPKEKRDKILDEKLEAELPGILAWLIKGCLEWQRIGLATPTSITDATDEYLTGEDNFEAWFKDCAERGHKDFEPLKTVYASWKAWCDENGEYVESNKAFRKRLENKGFKTTKTSLGVVVRGMYLTETKAEDAPF